MGYARCDCPDSAQVCRVVSGAGRAGASAVGGGGGPRMGWDGVTTVASATGLSRTTITVGLRELALPDKQRAAEGVRIRRPGGGRKALTQTDRGLLVALEAMIEPTTRGHPESPLRWTCQSTRRLAKALTRQRHPEGANTVASLLRQVGYSLQATRPPDFVVQSLGVKTQFTTPPTRFFQHFCEGWAKAGLDIPGGSPPGWA